MHIEVNGTRLWFDVEGPSLVPDGPRMRQRPTIILVHGGPASYDHSYFKPHFGRLDGVAQVVYLDLRDHGRSARHDPSTWTFEVCADDLRAFCDALGIVRPTVLGHSMGGFVAMLYGARHPGHAGALILSSTMARFDMDRLVEGFRRFGGEHIAEIGRRAFAGEPLTSGEWARAFAVFGPHVPDGDALARRLANPDLGAPGGARMRELDVVDQLARITSPTLVVVGRLEPHTPIAASEEIAAGLAPGIGRLEIIEAAGHFPWLDQPDRYFSVIGDFIR